jgi:raffinose synthase
VRERLPGARLRVEKPVPDFVDQFGWCTWDAFYQDVNPEKVIQGLKSFRKTGVMPRMMILDDGWQSVRYADGGTRLTSFKANRKFGGSLRPLVRRVKQEFGIRQFFVWHAFNGYWSGVDAKAFAKFGALDVTRQYGRDSLGLRPNYNHQYWGHLCGLVPAGKIAAFFDAYHAHLQAEGVDGVKVDVQGQLESLTQGQGGRVALTKAYRKGLESSVQRHFQGRLINCMSHATEMFYLSPQSTLTRTSTDFWPKDHRSYCGHLLTNAQLGLWFGEWIMPDWDMFHSKHPYAAYNAAGRALSGGPIYVSDKPGEHDPALLRKLVCADGTILRADGPGRPTADTLYRHPGKEGRTLKIFNRVGKAAVVGFFHPVCEPPTDAGKVTAVSDRLALSDVPDLPRVPHAVLAHSTGAIKRLSPGKTLPVRLQRAQWEIFTLAPIENGVAVLGLADKFNAAAAVRSATWINERTLELQLRDGGELVAWVEQKPSGIEFNGTEIRFQWRNQILRASTPCAGSVRIRLAAGSKAGLPVKIQPDRASAALHRQVKPRTTKK